MARKATWGSWAPDKVASMSALGPDEATVFMPWGIVDHGWPAFGELEAQRLARGWPGLEVFAWSAAYRGAFLTIRRSGNGPFVCPRCAVAYGTAQGAADCLTDHG
jgi:hypothetical protein